MSSTDKTIKHKGFGVPGSEDSATGAGGANKMDSFGKVWWEEAACLEQANMVQLGFLKTDDRGVSRNKSILNNCTFVRVA